MARRGNGQLNTDYELARPCRPRPELPRGRAPRGPSRYQHEGELPGAPLLAAQADARSGIVPPRASQADVRSGVVPPHACHSRGATVRTVCGRPDATPGPVRSGRSRRRGQAAVHIDGHFLYCVGARPAPAGHRHGPNGSDDGLAPQGVGKAGAGPLHQCGPHERRKVPRDYLSAPALTPGTPPTSPGARPRADDPPRADPGGARPRRRRP